MSENETMMNLLGISDWDNVFTLEGMVTTYFMIPFVPILIGIATIILLNKLGSKAEEDGTFEFVAALPMTRSTVYLTQSLVAVFLVCWYALHGRILCLFQLQPWNLAKHSIMYL